MKLKSKCCKKYKRKSHACKRCPLAAAGSKKLRKALSKSR